MIATDWTHFKHGIYRVEGNHMLVHANKMAIPKGYLSDGKPIAVIPLADYEYAWIVRVRKSLRDDRDAEHHQDGSSS